MGVKSAAQNLAPALSVAVRYLLVDMLGAQRSSSSRLSAESSAFCLHLPARQHRLNKHVTQSIVANAVVSVVPGAVFIQIVQSQLDKFESLSGASARKIVLVIGIMSAHALG